LDTQLDSNLIGTISNILQIIFNFIYLDLLSTPSSSDTEPKAVINARNLYDSCINETNIENDGVERVLNILNEEFGGWPILEGSTWNDTNYNLTNLLLQLRRYDNGIIFSVVTATNQENSSAYDIEVRNHVCYVISFF